MYLCVTSAYQISSFSLVTAIKQKAGRQLCAFAVFLVYILQKRIANKG